MDGAVSRVTASHGTWVGRIRNLPRSLVGGLSLALVIAAIAAIGPLLVGDPNAMDLHRTLQPPSPAHLLGTDNFGRDVLARIINGTALDLEFGIVVSRSSRPGWPSGCGPVRIGGSTPFSWASSTSWSRFHTSCS